VKARTVLKEMSKHVIRIAIAFVIVVVALALSNIFCGCGEVDENINKPTAKEVEKEKKVEEDKGPYCGDFVCNENKGEDYWNCLDCVDLFTGGPTNGYCGDGICYNESMISCWKDCRPRTYNDDDDFPLGPGVLITDPPWSPGPLVGLQPKDPQPKDPLPKLPHNK